MNQFHSYILSYRRHAVDLFFGLVFLQGALLTVAYAQSEQILYASQAPLLEQNPDAEPIPPAPLPISERTQKYIVLQNGSILFGNLKLLGNQYEITTETGTLVFPQTQITQIADNLRQIYTYRSAKVFVNDLEARCEMLRWCLQYELIDESDEQLALLKQYAPEHALVEVFERRLNFLKNKKQRKQEGENLIAPSVPQVAQAHVTNAELERFSETISQDAFDIFRKKVQPILQKNCMTAECHGPDSLTGYRLLRVSPRMARGEILQNLYASVKQLDARQPEKSPFLRKPVAPHGQDSRTIFMNQDYATYQILIAWTYLVTRNQYVIPREILLPSPSTVPIYTPTQRGLVRISSATPAPEVPWNMTGVDVSLYPQMLYPEAYAVKNPYASAQKQPNRTSVIPCENVVPEEVDTPEVLPASGEIPSETKPNQVVPVSAEENLTKPKPETDWEAVRRSINEALGETQKTENKPTTYYALGQRSNEGPIYAPGESSVKRLYRPGQSSAENLRRPLPHQGMTATPTAIPKPVSPSDLLNGRDSVSHGGGAYHYDPNSRASATSVTRGTLQWEQMLELQGGAETLKK